MLSPLNIEETVSRYNIDEVMKTELIAFDNFIWQDIKIESVEQLVAFEKDYQRLGENLGFCYDNEVGEFGCVETKDGPLSLMCKGRFQQLAEGITNNSVGKAFITAGLTDLETLMIMVFRADLSELFRLDAYYYKVPPVVQSLCEFLNQALSKLPIYSERVVRACNEYDKSDFKVGDLFKPGFCLTTSADLTWKNRSENRYNIQPLCNGQSKARAMFLINNNSEYQVTFLQEARFKIIAINAWGEGKKEIAMEEVRYASPS